jgi:acyl-CoA reductase-like NAD-dependent aldehyde dehydrogenase
MRNAICTIDSAPEMAKAAQRLRRTALEEPIETQSVLEIFEAWSSALNASALREIPGVTFLRLWLRRSTLERLLARELGNEFLEGEWREEGQARLRAFPVGLVGHWPAGNIEIQPLLSMSCALLGGNSSIVRVPADSAGAVRPMMDKLREADCDGLITERLALTFFDHDCKEMHQAMARVVDGAMIWGGAEAVTSVRGLPFPPGARLAVFGPRLSAAAMDAGSWSDQAQRRSWCRRIARDVWQFDQQACSSPQTLFLERSPKHDPAELLADLNRAFEQENRAHPRQTIHPALTSAICRARAAWLLQGEQNRAWFPRSPDWTILLGEGTDMPSPTQGRTLSVLVVDDLMQAISKFDGTVQTLGLAINDKNREKAVACAAGFRGVDRVVRLGQMHTFGSPWDGADLVRPMVRLVRHLPSQQGGGL